MVLRIDTVRVRLLRLEEVVSQLEELASLGADALAASVAHTWAVERGLALAAEILFDIGNHILSAHFGVAAESYEDILDQLALHGVLEADLRARLKGLGGFRNILIHDYLRLDRERVLATLQGVPRDFGDFAASVGSWLARLQSSGGANEGS